jgi:hypothetical protein
MLRLNLFAGLAKEEIEALAGRLHDQVWQRHQLILDPESGGESDLSSQDRRGAGLSDQPPRGGS